MLAAPARKNLKQKIDNKKPKTLLYQGLRRQTAQALDALLLHPAATANGISLHGLSQVANHLPEKVFTLWLAEVTA